VHVQPFHIFTIELRPVPYPFRAELMERKHVKRAEQRGPTCSRPERSDIAVKKYGHDRADQVQGDAQRRPLPHGPRLDCAHDVAVQPDRFGKSEQGLERQFAGQF
jgi:hypothetical protein